jgi:urease alpha subunit
MPTKRRSARISAHSLAHNISLIAVDAYEADPERAGSSHHFHAGGAGALSINFVSQASLDAGLSKRLRSRRQLQPVRQTRSVGKKDMRFNNAMPPVHIHPVTHEVTTNGARIGMVPLERVPLSRLYIVS